MPRPTDRRSGSPSILAVLTAVVVGLCLLLAAGPAARAQFAKPVAPAVLNDVTVSDAQPDEVRLKLGFAAVAPKFVLTNDESGQPTIALSLTTRGSAARVAAPPHSLLRNVDFTQDDSTLVIRFTTGRKAKIDAVAIGHTVSINLTAAAQSSAQADSAPPVAGLPRASDPVPGADGFEVVPLKYADVSEVVGLLTEGLTVKPNDSFTPQEPAFGSAGMSGGANYAPPPPPSPEVDNEAVGQSVDDTIAVDRRLNAIILKGPPDRIARLKAQIALIDVPVPSVVLETVFVELDQSGAHNLGLDFNNSSNQIGVATLQTGAFNIIGSGSEKPLTSVALQGAIYAQVSAGHGRIVSKPRIAAQSGSTAKIITGDALPILTSIALSGVNAVSQQVQYVNVGVTLQIAPRVSDDGFVTSHVFCVVSSVTGTSQGYPTISQREASTSATVHDGETFVIGGLTQESEIKSVNRFPGLADIPLAGELFKYRAGTRSKTELYIVVTPHIIHRGDGSAALPPDPPAAKG
jgi:general secretion pathway protein D